MSVRNRVQVPYIIDDRHRVEILAACRRQGIGSRLYINKGKEPRIDVSRQPLEPEMWCATWQQLERIGAGEDVAAVLGGKR